MARLVLSPKILDGLDFGAPSAERDIGRGLEKCFVESAAYHRVHSGAKTVLLGNRGSGKSAIFQVLAKRERTAGNRVIELSPEDYSYELLSSTMAAENAGSWAKHGAYAAAWKYLLYVLVMKEIARKGMRLAKGAGAEIHGYIRNNHANVQMGRLSVLVSYLKRLENIKLGPIEAGAKTRELDRLYKLEEINSLLPALRKVLDKQRVTIVVDELDRGWDSSEDAKAFVSGLFQACVSVNALHRNLSVYISLRRELYDDIPALYEDAQKYRDLLETIRWREDSLLELIAKRIRYSAREMGYDAQVLDRTDDLTCWNAVFAPLPGAPVDSSFRYVADRTLYRPREIIEFCTTVLEVARDRTPTLPLPYETIRWAERGYSEERAKDIAAEYRFQYPGLLGVFEVFRGRDHAFEREELQLLCLELVLGEIPTNGASSWLPLCDPDGLIEILWQTGFLTAQPVGDADAVGGQGAFIGVHQVQHLNLAAVQRFQVHPMFRAYLGVQRRDGD
ncbi:P-loop ATPase, Sll1717 family [Actinoallomurus sp. CA-150999]|uniref:P-loop ATPase, Sll1717 family n=1 Tax=Actinoallomurus sp. CA-150999 TaxID=3239887 RepID=UPI003D9003B7